MPFIHSKPFLFIYDISKNWSCVDVNKATHLVPKKLWKWRTATWKDKCGWLSLLSYSNMGDIRELKVSSSQHEIDYWRCYWLQHLIKSTTVISFYMYTLLYVQNYMQLERRINVEEVVKVANWSPCRNPPYPRSEWQSSLVRVQARILGTW
jgi:hypothetical protein